MKTTISTSLEETQVIAAEWLKEMSDLHANRERALVVGLSGHLGAGKTAFTKAVGKELGITEEITSPTFVIMKIYPTTHPKWKKLVHIDAYRLERAEEVQVLGFENIIADVENLVLLEWPENIKDAVQAVPEYQEIRFRIPDEVSDTKNREIIFA